MLACLLFILFDFEYVSAYTYYDDRIVESYSTGDFIAYTDSDLPIYTPDYEIIDLRTKPGPIIVPNSYEWTS